MGIKVYSMFKLTPWLSSSLVAFKSQIRSDTLHHAILINGKKGIGKQNLAFALAHDIVVPHNEVVVVPTLKDVNGNDFEPFKNYPYAIEGITFISTESEKSDQISIDQIRSITSTVHFKNNIYEKKVIVIANINDLTISAQNALLKILEEPPTNTYFILLQDENSLILPTIKSRCSHHTINHLHVNSFIGSYLNLKILNQFNFNLKDILNHDRDYIINQSLFIDNIINDIYDGTKSFNLLTVSKDVIEKNLFSVFLNSCVNLLFDIIHNNKCSLSSAKNIYMLFDKINMVKVLVKHNFNKEMFLVGLLRGIQNI